MAVIAPVSFEGDRELPEVADVVVIGGGIVGVSTALFLTERGVKVALCEKGQIGAEQSGRNWGWVRQMGRDAAELPLAIESLRLWQELGGRLANDTGFRQTGIVYFSETPSLNRAHEAWLEQARPFQLPTRLLTSSEIAEMLPGIKNPPRAGLYTPTDGRAEPHMAAPAIAEGARAAGASILTNCAVRGVERQAGRVSGVATERGIIKCSSVVLAGGAWSRLFAGNLGIDFPQLKILATAARMEGVEGVPDMPVGAFDFAFRKRLDGGFTMTRRNINISPITPDSFRLFGDYVPALVKQWSELRLRIGGQFFEELAMPRQWSLDAPTIFEKVRVLDPAPVEKVNRQGLANISRSFPAFAAGRITHHWAGMIDVTPDAVPVLSPIAAIPGFFIASGLSGHGFGLGPGAGRLMADLVTGATPIVDPAPFKFERLRKPAHTSAPVNA